MRRFLAIVLLACLARNFGPQPPQRRRESVLRVCSDPNNLPFSNARLEGFENHIASLLAKELRTRVSYTWWPGYQGLVQNALNAGRCDVLIGVPRDFGQALTTEPYYRSSYVFVTQRERHLDVRSLEDARLARLRVGVHVMGRDGERTRVAQALPVGLANDVAGFRIYGDDREASSPYDLLHAVDAGALDVAVAWGPLASAYARRSKHALELTDVPAARDGASPFRCELSLAVRKGDVARKAELERALLRRRGQVQRVLRAYGIPEVGDRTALASSSR